MVIGEPKREPHEQDGSLTNYKDGMSEGEGKNWKKKKERRKKIIKI